MALTETNLGREDGDEELREKVNWVSKEVGWPMRAHLGTKGSSNDSIRSTSNEDEEGPNTQGEAEDENTEKDNNAARNKVDGDAGNEGGSNDERSTDGGDGYTADTSPLLAVVP